MPEQNFTIEIRITDDGFTQVHLAKLLHLLANTIDKQVQNRSDEIAGPVHVSFATEAYTVDCQHHKQKQFTPAAQRLWNAIPAAFKPRLLESVWCAHCSAMTTMINFHGRAERGDLILSGSCQRCGGKVVRVAEGG